MTLPVDPLSTLRLAAAWLAEHPDLEVRAFGAWVATFPAELSCWFGVENSPGRSGRQALLLAERDAVIQAIRLPASRLARELTRYHSDCWPRDRLHESCPYPLEDRRAQYWRLLRLAPNALSQRRIEQIRRKSRNQPPVHFASVGDRSGRTCEEG